MARPRKTIKPRAGREGAASRGEERLLSYLNNPQPPLQMVTDIAFAGVLLTVEHAAALIAARSQLGGRFTSFRQVTEVPGIDVDGFRQLLAGLELPRHQVVVSKADIAALQELWRGLTKAELARVQIVYPGYGPAVGAEIYATSIAVGVAPAEVPIEIVWREFWKRVGAWLAKRGIAAGAIALADGPLPIGDLIAIGIGVWTLIELLDVLALLWEEAVLAASTSDLARKAWEMVPTLEEHIGSKLPGQVPCTPLWHYYIREIISKLRTMLEKVQKIPAGKKAAEAAEKLGQLVREFIEKVRERSPDAVAVVEQALRAAGLLR